MNKSWGEIYFDHFQRYFGVPTHRHAFRQNDTLPSIQTLVFEKVFEGCLVFCSLGLSHYSQEVGKTVEVMLPCDAQWDKIPRILANGLFYMIQEKIAIGRGIAISGVKTVEPEFSKITGKNAIYITTPFGLPESFSSLNENGETGWIYLAFLITQNEYEFFCDNGADKFEDLIESKNVDPYHIMRPSCV